MDVVDDVLEFYQVSGRSDSNAASGKYPTKRAGFLIPAGSDRSKTIVSYLDGPFP